MRTIQLTDDALAQLQDLKYRTEDKDEAEVIKRALSIYDVLTMQIMNGGKVYIHRSDGIKIEVLLF